MVWVATSDGVIGLVVESPGMGQLVKDLQDVIPTLLEENHQPAITTPIELLPVKSHSPYLSDEPV